MGGIELDFYTNARLLQGSEPDSVAKDIACDQREKKSR